MTLVFSKLADVADHLDNRAIIELRVHRKKGAHAALVLVDIAEQLRRSNYDPSADNNFGQDPNFIARMTISDNPEPFE